MMAAGLYQQTLAGYEASLGKGESIALSRYSKVHHVNNRGMGYWMKKHSIVPPGNKLRKIATANMFSHRLCSFSRNVTSKGPLAMCLLFSICNA